MTPRRSRTWTPTTGASLTARQREFLRRTALGQSWEQIGTALSLTIGGVGSLSKQVLLKLGAHSAAHAVHLAHERGLLGRPGRLAVAEARRKPGASPDDARRIAARLEATYRTTTGAAR